MYNELRTLKMIPSTARHRRFALLLLIFFLLFLLGLIFIPWQQTVMGTGKVIAYSPTDRQQIISATVTGRIATWLVNEGTHVKKGQPIVEIEDTDPDLISRLEMEKKAIELRYMAVKQAATIAKKNVNRQKILFDKGINSERDYEQANITYNKQLSEVAGARIELTKIKTKIARQRNQLVVAPMSGTILRRVAGQDSVIVKSGSELAILVPDTHSRAVELWVDGNDVPLLDPKQPVRLQFEGWPAIQFSGWPSVAVGTFGGHIRFIDAAANNQGLFRVVVVPDTVTSWPSANYLRQGVRVHGWVLINQVKLGFELWRQFNGFPPIKQQHAP